MSEPAVPPSQPLAPAPAREFFVLRAEPSSLRQVRAQLGRFLAAQRVDDEVFYDALLVAHELAANAIPHGSAPRDEIEVQAELLRDRLRLTVFDRARGSAPFAFTADEHRESGRGLQIVGRLSEWSERIVAGRREVSAELPLSYAPARDTARVRPDVRETRG
jgi:anti-sigma regulatory factor (Ser/Thr protein kinase)